MAAIVPFFPGLMLTNRQAASITDNGIIDLCVSENAAIAGATGPFVGVELDIPWKSIEDDTPNVYNFTRLIAACDYAGLNGMVVRVLLTTKYTSPPNYFNNTSLFGGNPGHFTTGTPGGATTKMHRMWVPQVQARWAAMYAAFTANIVNYSNPGNPAKQARVRAAFYGICVQEPHTGNATPSPAEQGIPANYDQQYTLGLIACAENARNVSMPARMVWQMANVQNNDGLNEIVASAVANGYGLCGPDTFPMEPHVTTAGASPMSVRHGYNAQFANKLRIPCSLHVYTENYGKPWHDAQKDHIGHVGPQPIFATGRTPFRPPGAPLDSDNNGGLGIHNFAIQQGLHNLIIVPTNVNAGWTLPSGVPTPGDVNGNPTFNGWDRYQAFLRSGDFSNANGAGGLSIAIPTKIDSGGGSPPPAPTLTLNSDTGTADTPPRTNTGAVTVGGVVAPNPWQISTNGGSSWGANNTAPTPSAGSNTWIARQVNATTGASASSAALTFVYDTTIPALVGAQINGVDLAIVFDEQIAAGAFQAAKTTYTVEYDNGAGYVVQAIDSRNATGSQVNLVMTVAATETTVVRVSYAKPATGTARIQDLAGNYADSINNQSVTNNTTIAAPTQTTVIVSITDAVAPITGVVASGGATNDPALLLAGTISASLGSGEQVQLLRNGSPIGIATTVSSDWSYSESSLVHDTTYIYTARVIRGSQSGPTSAAYVIKALLNPPVVPVVDPQTSEDSTPEVTGTWVNVPGYSLSVVIYGPGGFLSPAYALGGPDLSAAGNIWTLVVPTAMPHGIYTVIATVTDSAGNSSESIGEDNLDIARLIQPGSRLRLKLFA